MITGIHHIAIIVSSEKSVAFYKNLGFKEIFRKERDYDSIVLLDSPGIRLELFIDPNHPPRTEKPETLGLRHLAIKTDNFDELIKKYKCEEPKHDWLGERYIFIPDPDGVLIEIHE